MSDLETLFIKHTTLHQELAEMNQDAAYDEADWIQTVYIAIEGSKQFTKPCLKWKGANSNNTETLLRTFFRKEYNIWNKEHDSLQLMGVANSVQMTQKQLDLELSVQRQETELSKLRRELELANQVNAQKIAAAAQTSTAQQQLAIAGAAQTATDNSTVIKTLEAQQKQILQLMKQQQPGCLLHEQQRNRTFQRGPKTEKRFKNYHGVCYTHGYDVAPRHNSSTCRPESRKPGNDESHTGDNPVPGASEKEKKFSKWAE